MAEADATLLPETLMAEILVFVLKAPHPHQAFCALIGAAVGACGGAVSRRDMAETLWLLGDHTVELGAAS